MGQTKKALGNIDLFLDESGELTRIEAGGFFRYERTGPCDSLLSIEQTDDARLGGRLEVRFEARGGSLLVSSSPNRPAQEEAAETAETAKAADKTTIEDSGRASRSTYYGAASLRRNDRGDFSRFSAPVKVDKPDHE